MFKGSLVGRIILFTPIFFFIIQDFLFLDTKMAHNLAKSSRALLQQYLYLAFQYFFMVARSYLSDRKENTFLWYFLNLNLLYHLVPFCLFLNEDRPRATKQ